MQTLKNLKERTQWAIDHIVKEHNLKNMEISRLTGSKPDTIRKYRTKIATPNIRFLQRFSATFGVDFKWLSAGIGVPFPDMQAKSPTPSDAAAEDTNDRAPADEAPDTIRADTEMSFQKLALLAGIKIDNEWTLKLSRLIDVASWKISLSIHHQRIDSELVQAVERCGYKKETWIVDPPSEPAIPTAENDILNTSLLLKIAEKVLQSNTIHATSLAMNIISLKAVSDHHSTPLMGARAITLPKTHGLQLIK